MLVLGRRIDESIRIATPSEEEIVITVTYVRGKKVGIGVDANSTIKILRGEIAERIKQEGSV